MKIPNSQLVIDLALWSARQVCRLRGDRHRIRKLSASLSGAVLLALPSVSHGMLIMADDFEADTPKFPWYMDATAGETRFVEVVTNALFQSKALRYHMTTPTSGQQELVGQMSLPVDMSPEGVTSLTLQFDFYFNYPAVPLAKAFNFGIGSSMGTPLTNHNQVTTLGADDRSFNSYIGWLTPYCRIQYEGSVTVSGHGRGATLATDYTVMISAPDTIGTARMTLTKNGDMYDILVEYREGTNDFVQGLSTTYAQTVTNWDQVLFGWGSFGANPLPPEGADLYMDNLMIFTNNDPTPPPELPRLSYEIVGSQFVLTWPTNAGWRLESQTNPLNVGLQPGSGNWGPVSGAGDGYHAQPLNTGAGTVFYRLVAP